MGLPTDFGMGARLRLEHEEVRHLHEHYATTFVRIAKDAEPVFEEIRRIPGRQAQRILKPSRRTGSASTSKPELHSVFDYPFRLYLAFLRALQDDLFQHRDRDGDVVWWLLRCLTQLDGKMGAMLKHLDEYCTSGTTRREPQSCSGARSERYCESPRSSARSPRADENAFPALMVWSPFSESSQSSPFVATMNSMNTATEEASWSSPAMAAETALRSEDARREGEEGDGGGEDEYENVCPF